MIRGIKLLNTKSISGVTTATLQLNRFQTRSFINSTTKSFSKINSNNQNNNNNNNKFINNKRSYSTESNNNNINNINTNLTNEINNNITTTTATTITNKYPEYVKVETLAQDESSVGQWVTDLIFTNVEFLNGLHEQYGLTWVGIVAGLAISLRALTFPVTVRTQRIAAKMREVRKETEKHSYLNDGTAEGRLKLYQLQNQIMTKHGVSTFSAIAPNLVLLPVLIYPFVIIRNISEHTTLLDNIPFLWIDSLSAIDPYYLLPILSSAFQILSSRLSMTPETHPIMKGFMYSLGLLPLLFTVHFSAALNIYWCTNSILFCVTNLFFKSKFGANLFNIPYEDPKAKKSNIVIAPDQFTQVKTIEDNKESIDKNNKLKESIKNKNYIIEQKKEELKAFRRKKN